MRDQGLTVGFGKFGLGMQARFQVWLLASLACVVNGLPVQAQVTSPQSLTSPQALTSPRPFPYQEEGVGGDGSFSVERGAVEGSASGSVGGERPETEIPRLADLDRPATTVTDWVAQMEAALVQITGVRVETTEAGLQVILETAGSLEVPMPETVGNALIANIPNATIAENFEQTEPFAGIARVEVTNLPGDRVRVAITGTDAPPVAQISSAAEGLAFAVTTGTATAAGEEEIELVVTGEQDEGYSPSSANTATRTDTPLRDIPQSIQVVPRQVIEDRRPRSVIEAVETVSGVLDGSNNNGAPGGTNIIRGFVSFDSGNLRNGFRDIDYYSATSLSTIERIEVLKGPASVLFGAQEPGGVINVITRQPLDEPYYNLAFEAGTYSFYQPSIDLSGPLTADGSVLYRFIAAYQSAESYQDFVDSSTTTIAPSLTFRFGEQTDLNLSYEYVRYFADNPPSDYLPLLSDGNLPPRSFYPAYPDLDLSEITTHRIGATLNHRFSENWQLRNNLAIVLNDRVLNRNVFDTLTDDSILSDGQVDRGSSWANNYFGQIDLLGRFNTGSIQHQLLVGFDVNFFESPYEEFSAPLPDLNIFNPDYDIPIPETSLDRTFYTLTEGYGIYLQNQIAFNDDLKLLIGGRYDWVSTQSAIDGPFQNDGAFSPRVGLVYQPSDTVSLYASYNRSFKPSINFSQDGETFEPTVGTQYEVGTRIDFLEGRLSANLAAYHLTRTNILTPDPEDPQLTVQTGEARSQGVELDLTGEILPGWNVILSYAYTDAEVTEDNATPIGNRLDNVPFNQASLWTTYEIQEGALRGLGLGVGLFYVGERQGDLANSFELPSYVRTDAAVYYRRDRVKAAVNLRNLFDIDYVGYSFGRNFNQRGTPLTITASFSWDF